MSQFSTVSSMSVSAFGDGEMNLGDALDRLFTELQEHMNGTHCATRSLAMSPDQDDDFKVCVEHEDSIIDSVDDMIELFKELKKIIPQVRGKPKDDEEKTWWLAHKERRKIDKKLEKEREKMDNMSLSEIKE